MTVGGKAGTKEDAVWCSLVFTVNCRDSAGVFASLDGLQRGAIPLSSP